MPKRLALLTCLFVFLDQISKGIINLSMSLNQSITMIAGFFNVTYVHNTGAAFSILAGNRWLLILLAIVALNLIYHFFIKNKQLTNKECIIYALLIGGIIGNVIDRLLYGYVIDFLAFTFFGYSFAIFNFADTFIVIAIILLIWMSWGNEKCKNTSLN